MGTKTKTPPPADPAPATDETPLRIVQFSATNFMKLKAVHITPAGRLTQITGRNGQGKSAVLKAIMSAIGGAAFYPEKPVRLGEDQADIDIDMGELVAHLTFRPDGSASLRVTDKPGNKLPSPRAALDKLRASIGFDPLAFVRMHPREQVATLMRLVGLEERLANLDAKRKAAYEERTIVNREADRLKKQWEAMADAEGDEEIPEEEVSVADLVAAREAALKECRTNQEGRVWLAGVISRAAVLKGEIAQAELKLAEMRRDLADAEQTIAAKEEEISGWVDPEVPDIADAVARADQINARIRQRNQRRDLGAQLTEKQLASDKLTETLGKIDQRKADLVAAAPFPVPGLGFGEGGDGVTLNGIPLSQASQGEQLRCTVAIAMALNPRLRVCLVDEASVLDADGLAALGELAEEHDMQVWLTRVSNEGGVGIEIEAGEVVAAS